MRIITFLCFGFFFNQSNAAVVICTFMVNAQTGADNRSFGILSMIPICQKNRQKVQIIAHSATQLIFGNFILPVCDPKSMKGTVGTLSFLFVCTVNTL